MSVKFVKFLFVGALNTAFGYSLFALLYLLTDQYRLAIVIATAIGVLFNFFTTGRLVFANSDRRRLIPFVLTYVFTLGLNILVLDLLVGLGLDPLLGQAICLPLIVIITYEVNARFVFAGRVGQT